MHAIERDIFLLSDRTAVQPPIEYVQGTNGIPIIFHFRDYDIPQNATVKVYVHKPSGKAEYDLISTVTGNDVMIEVKDTMFSEMGNSHIQLCVKDGEKTVVSFSYPADVKRNNVAGEVPPSGNNSNFLDEYLGKIDERLDSAEDLADKALLAADEAVGAAENTYKSATEASESAELAKNYATEAESFAHGRTGTRENEDVDCARYFYEQAKHISQGMSGIIPMGTITFADLSNPDNQVAKYMFNISDEFVTDETFKEGAGYEYAAGTNVYRTSDGYWDCFAGSFLPLDGDSKENTVTFESRDAAEANVWTDVGVLASGEKHSSIFNKVSTMFKNVRYLYKMLGTTDISAIGGGTVTGAIASQNEALKTVNANLRKQYIQCGGVTCTYYTPYFLRAIVTLPVAYSRAIAGFASKATNVSDASSHVSCLLDGNNKINIFIENENGIFTSSNKQIVYWMTVGVL